MLLTRKFAVAVSAISTVMANHVAMLNSRNGGGIPYIGQSSIENAGEVAFAMGQCS